MQFSPDNAGLEDFMSIDAVDTADLLSAQIATAEWLDELGATPDDEVSNQAQTAAAREAFKVVIADQDPHDQKTKLLQLKTPAAVRHITGMLTAYDWEFVAMAKELRGYTVAKLFEETQSPNANIRLKALIALGKVTEVGLFTEQIEVKKIEMSDAEVEQRIKDKLAKFMGVIDVVDVSERPDDSPEEKNDGPDGL